MVGVLESKEKESHLPKVENFFCASKDEKSLILCYNKENPIWLNVKIALVKGVDTLNRYFSFYHEVSPKFREYINIITQTKRKDINEELLLYLIDTYFHAVEEVYNATVKEVDINWHTKEGKGTKGRARVAFYKKDVEELVRFVTAITMGVPLLFAVTGKDSSQRYFNINIIDLLINKFTIYYNLIRLAYSRIKLDGSKEIFGLFNVPLSSNSAFLSNFLFVLFTLFPTNKLLLPPRYRDSKDKNIAGNFFAFFLSAISENNSFILKTYINNYQIDSIGLEYLLRKEASTDLLNVINTILTTNKIIRTVPSRLINRYKPTTISQAVVEMCKVIFKVSEQEIMNNLLEYQYALFMVLSRDEKLKKVVGHGIELLNLGTDGKRIAQNKKIYTNTSEKIVANLLEAQGPYTKLIINKVGKMSLIRNYQLYYLDKEKETPFTNYSMLNKMITEFLRLYILIVVEENQKFINYVRRLARVLKLNTIDVKEIKSFAERMGL